MSGEMEVPDKADPGKEKAVPEAPALIKFRKQVAAVLEARCVELDIWCDALSERSGVSSYLIAAAMMGDYLPTAKELRQLSDALGIDLVARFPPRFLGFAVPKEALRDPANVGARLQHVVNLVMLGNLRKLSGAASITDYALKRAIKNEKPLTEKQLAQLLAAIPSLRGSWLASGKGKPFSSTEPLTVVQQPPRLIVPRPVSEPHPNAAGPRVRTPVEIAIYEQWLPSAHIKFGELDKPRFTTLHNLGHRLLITAQSEAGLDPAQVADVARLLINMADYFQVHFGPTE